MINFTELRNEENLTSYCNTSAQEIDNKQLSLYGFFRNNYASFNALGNGAILTETVNKGLNFINILPSSIGTW